MQPRRIVHEDISLTQTKIKMEQNCQNKRQLHENTRHEIGRRLQSDATCPAELSLISSVYCCNYFFGGALLFKIDPSIKHSLWNWNTYKPS